jgi:hypothetical protein
LERNSRYDLVTIEVAKQLMDIGVPQISNYWYVARFESGVHYYQRNFGNANEFMRKINSGVAFDKAVLVSAFTSTELDRMLAKKWDKRIEPVPVFEQDVLFWVVPAFDIKDENLACAKGLVILKLLQDNSIALDDLYFPDSSVQD